MKLPLIRRPLPGPKASAYVRPEDVYVSPSYTRVYPLLVKRAEGLWVGGSRVKVWNIEERMG